MYRKLALILALAFALGGCSAQDKAVETAAQTEDAEVVILPQTETVTAFAEIADSSNMLAEEQKAPLYDFALCWAETLTAAQPAEISHLFADTEGEQRYINETAYSTLCCIRNMRDVDLTLEYSKVVYNITAAYPYGSGIMVELLEDNVQKFRHLEGESFTYNTFHKFLLTETADGWKIGYHIQEEDFFLLAQEAWEDAKGATFAEKSDMAVQLLKADAEENFVLSAEYPNEYKETAVSKEYDREKAVEYAEEWCNKRNSDYLEYDLYGGNCQNFASQCIHAGGMDMDIRGHYTCQWKFYGKELNFNQTANGRSYSFIGVDEFYTYAEYNSTTGISLQEDIDLDYAQKGDVIQVGAYYEWRHSLVVTDVLRDENGNMTEIILASNTADRWNYPLSAYIYTYPRLIHIDGQI